MKKKKQEAKQKKRAAYELASRIMPLRTAATAPPVPLFIPPGRNGNGHHTGPIGVPVTADAKTLTAKMATDERRKPIAKLVEEIEADPQFKLGYLVVQALFESANVSIEAQGGPRAQLLADNLTDVWKENVKHIMRAFAFGRAAFNRWYSEYDQAAGIRRVEGLDFLPFEETEMQLTDDGHFDGIKLTVKGETERLDPAESWWFALDPTPREPHGRSRYLGAAYEVFKQRKALTEAQGRFASKFANGVFTGKAPAQYPTNTTAYHGDQGSLNQGSQPKNPQSDLADSFVAAKDGGVIIMDSATDEKGVPLFSLDATPIQASAAPLENRQQSLDDAALISIGVPPRAVTQDSSVGSLALSQTHLKVLNTTVEGVLSQAISSYQKYVIDKAVAVNFAPGSGVVLTMVWQPLSEDRTDVVLELVKQIIVAPAVPPLILNGIVDLAKMLEIAKLPVGEDLAGKLAEIAAQPPAAPGGFGMARQLSLAQDPPADPQPIPSDAETESTIAAKAAREAVVLMAEIKAALADPSAIDRRHL